MDHLTRSPGIPAPGSALRSHPCGAVPSFQVPSVYPFFRRTT
jgi:hypothetical protein